MRLSVKFAVSLDIASKGPDLRGNLQNTIGFADSQTEKKTVKTCTAIPPGPDCIDLQIYFRLQT